ncbi:hypothetical protein GJ496_011993 [Pomphorhynchus laevis]|nr:hypothetical protein GJ496_011993 [Pomphorhynchus laevis]
MNKPTDLNSLPTIVNSSEIFYRKLNDYLKAELLLFSFTMNGSLHINDEQQSDAKNFSLNDNIFATASSTTRTNSTTNNKQSKYKKRSTNGSTDIYLSNSTDYYTLLGIPKHANESEIKIAYKKLAFLYHPDKNKEQDSHRRFAKISAAFDVLSNPAKRHIYDMYGHDSVKRSATFNYGDTTPVNDKSVRNHSFYNEFNGFSKHTNGESIFVDDDDKSARIVYKDPPIYHDLYVGLEEILEGITKKVKVTRKIFKSDLSSKIEEKTLVIEIKPGWKAGTKIIFEREGDRRPGVLPADIIFVLRDKPHPYFKRNGSDVIFTARISLKSSLLGDQLMIPMLNKRTKLLKWREVINPRSEKRLRGMGLPNSTIPGSRGDLIVRFEIEFPKSLSEEERQLVNCAIPPFNANYEDL